MPRMGTMPREEWKTYSDVFDSFTEKQIWSLISKRVIDGLVGQVSIGKEANIFTAEKDGKTVIVKIYRLSTCDFNRMYSFIRTDPRFPELNRQRRKVVFAWAKREYRNLLKVREAGVRVPTPIAYLFNILVMEFVGDVDAAQKIKTQIPKDKKKFIDELIQQMRKIHKAGLVHGDLSAFNVLNHNEKPVIIDLSQMTTLKDPNAQDYFQRDIRNIAAYANKIGVKITEKELEQKVKA